MKRLRKAPKLLFGLGIPLAITLLVVLAVVGNPIPNSATVTEQELVELTEALEPEIGEVVEKRTETSKTFYRGVGSYTLVAAGPMHYQDTGGQWLQINNEIVSGVMSEDVYDFHLLQSTFDAGQIVEVSCDDSHVRFQPMPLQWNNDLGQIELIIIPQEVEGVVTNTEIPMVEPGDGYYEGRVDWADAYGTGRHFSYTVKPHRIAKLLTIDSTLPAPAQYIIDGGGAVLQLSFIFDPSSDLEIYVDGLLWDKKAEKSTFDAIEFRRDGEFIWQFDSALYWDSGGEQQLGITTLRKVGNNLWVDVLVPYTWLQAASYPVYVDPEITVFSSTSDGDLRDGDGSYTTAQGYATGSIAASGQTFVIGQTKVGSDFYVIRGFVFFDTSEVEEGSGIESAVLSLHGQYDGSTADFYIRLQNGMPDYPNDPLEAGDYNKAWYGGTVYGATSGYTSSFTTADYNAMTFSATGRAWIQMGSGAVSKFCLRSSEDLGISEPVGEEYVVVWSANKGVGYQPKLVVNYNPDPDVVIDDSVQSYLYYFANRGGPFWTSPDDGYVIYTDITTNDLVYRKTTDGGETWSAINTIVAGAIISYDCWADWQTPGDGGTVIHIAYLNSDTEYVCYASLDTDGAAEVLDNIQVCAGTGLFNAGTYRVYHTISITKTRGGNLAVATQYRDSNVSATYFYRFFTSPDGDTWTVESSTAGNPVEHYYDHFLLFPANLADDQDLWAAYWDDDAAIVSLKTYDDSGNSWTTIGEATISGTMVHANVYVNMDGAIRHSDGHLILAAWTAYDTTTADLKLWDINGAGSITETTDDVLTDSAESFLTSVFIDQASDNIYVAYAKGGAVGSTVTVYYKKSTDGGDGWGSQATMQTNVADDNKWISCGAVNAAWGGKFQPIWFDDDDNDLFTNAVYGITIEAVGEEAAGYSYGVIIG